jgi:hypothetical protein
MFRIVQVYEFAVQYPQQHQFVSLGKIAVDLAQYAESQYHALSLPLHVSSPGGHATLNLVVTATPMKSILGEDAISMISGASGLSGSPVVTDQDLHGFDEGTSFRRRVSGSVLPSPSRSPQHSRMVSRGSGGLASMDAEADGDVLGQTASPSRTMQQRQEQQQSQRRAAQEVPPNGAPTPSSAQPPLQSQPDQQGSNCGNDTNNNYTSEVDPNDAAYSSTPIEAEAEKGKQQQQQPEESIDASNRSVTASPVPVPHRHRTTSTAGSEHERHTELVMDTQQQDHAQAVRPPSSIGRATARSPSRSPQRPPSSVAATGLSLSPVQEPPHHHQLVQAAQLRADEAEAMLEEAVGMVETERAQRRQAEASIERLQRDLEWAERRAAKERADWEGRMKEAFRKMEQTVMLTERVQREKSELTERLAALTEENQKVRESGDPTTVEAKIAEASLAAKESAEQAAALEIRMLHAKLREMEEFVEEADAKALRAQERATALQAQLVGGDIAGTSRGGRPRSSRSQGIRAFHRGGEGDEEEEISWEQLRAAQERAEALSLELEYARADCRSLEEELKAAREDADRTIATSRREMEMHARRASELMRQVEEARAMTAAAERRASQLHGRVVFLEDTMERNRVQGDKVQKPIVSSSSGRESLEEVDVTQRQNEGQAFYTDVGERSGSQHKGGPSPAAELQALQRHVSELQLAAEERTHELATASHEVASMQAAISVLEAELHAARQQTVDAKQHLSLREEEVQHLRQQMAARADQSAEIRKLRRELAVVSASAAAARSRPSSAPAKAFDPSASFSSSRPGSPAGSLYTGVLDITDGDVLENTDDVAELVSTLTRRAKEAEALAASAAVRTANLVQQLAVSQAEKQEATSKFTEMYEEIARLRGGTEGQLRERIEALERELVVVRNRAEVNALFREEHERIAGELVESKLALAEAQEDILVLRRERFKAEEKQMSFASKLTSLEAKLYKKLSASATNIGKRRSLRPGSALSGSSDDLSRPNSRSREGPSRGN